MNKKLLTTLAVTTALISFPAYADIKAGDVCTSNGGIMTRATEAMDDLVACANGTWHSMLGGSAPSGGIMAFNLTSCPSGWKELSYLAGRTIIGAGQGTGLTARTAGTTGGEETHTMTIAELVPHTHGVGFTWSESGNYRGYEYPVSSWPANRENLYTPSQSTGSGQPFNVMMPWVALIYCEKQ